MAAILTSEETSRLRRTRSHAHRSDINIVNQWIDIEAVDSIDVDRLQQYADSCIEAMVPHAPRAIRFSFDRARPTVCVTIGQLITPDAAFRMGDTLQNALETPLCCVSLHSSRATFAVRSGYLGKTMSPQARRWPTLAAPSLEQFARIWGVRRHLSSPAPANDLPA